MRSVCNVTFNSKPNWFVNVSNIPSNVLPYVVAKSKDITNAATHINVTDLDLEVLNLSWMDNAIGSMIDILDVIPANNKHRKNSGPITYPNVPIALNISGNAINARPVPWDTSSPIGILFVVLIVNLKCYKRKLF